MKIVGINSSDECVLNAIASLRKTRLLRHWDAAIITLILYIDFNYRITSFASCVNNPLTRAAIIRWRSFMKENDVMSHSVINANILLNRYHVVHARR